MIDSVFDWRWMLFVLLGAAAVGDIRSYRIPNIIPVGVIIALVVALVASSAPAEDYAAASASGLIGLGVGYAFFRFGLMGGGDGKLFAAAAAWFNAGALLSVGFFVSLAGIAVALAALAARSLRPATPTTAGGGAMKSLLKTRIPYGVAIAAGVAIATSSPPLI